MVTKCANRGCPATRQKRDDGKLFRLDLELGSKAGGTEHRIEYLWLCSDCAQRMHPRVEVTGKTIKIRLSSNEPIPPADAHLMPLRLWLN